MTKLLSFLNKIDHVFETAQKVLIAAGVLWMVIINGAQVFCRFVLHASIPWSEQVSIMCFFILIMLGGNLAIRSDTETRIEILRFKSEKANIIIRLISDLVCIVALAIFFYSSILLVKQTARFPQYLSSIMLNYVYIYLWLLVGFGLMIFDKIINVVKGLCRLLEKEENK